MAAHDQIWEWLYPDEEYREEVSVLVEEILDGDREVEAYKTTIKTKGDGRRTISWNSHPLENEDGTINGSVAIGRDVTERERRVSTIRERNKELEGYNVR